MLVPLSWLKEYVDIDVEAKELEEKLFSCGFEVEESYEVGKDISGVVVGLVEECEPIPETHLHVCKVNVGGAEPLQICCGADNVHAGGKYPVALEEPNKKAVDDLLACLDDADAAVSPAEKPKAHISEKKAERKKSVPVR